MAVQIHRLWPDGVSDAQAVSLLVAGLTALHALRKGGLLLGKKVLVDGALGGVGHMAIQLAAAASVKVYAPICQSAQQALVSAACAGDYDLAAWQAGRADASL